MTYSLLSTDGYKFSMAAAGFPLRNETFYYSHRHGGAQYLPLDVKSYVQRLLPEVLADHYSYLTANDYEMGAAFKAAWDRVDELKIHTLPEGSWFFEREPVFSITGPSAIVSWLEPLALMLNYRIQIATLALTNPENLAAEVGSVTCIEQREIVMETLESVGVKAPEITVDSELYFSTVLKQVKELVEIVGDSGRIFEVGMRAATCLGQHRIALQACAEAGVKRTSNVELARELDMIPVGTMGHEHVQRFGSDREAFRAMTDRRPGRSSFLLDTFDTISSGMPAAFEIIAERPEAGHSVRYDSGDKVTQYLCLVERAKVLGLQPVHILEDGFDAKLTRKFEELRVQVGVAEDQQYYGYGGHIVARTAPGGLTRDRVSAVYKLTETAGQPRMKFGNEAGLGKQSIPGRPVVFRRTSSGGSISIIGQESEAVPAGYRLLTGAEPSTGTVAGQLAKFENTEVMLSDATKKLIQLIRSQVE